MQPYIKLNESFPGIVSLFMYDRENAKNLMKMGQTIMRRTRSLSPGARELIFAYTSNLNGCNFCYQSHEACASEFLNADVVKCVVRKHDLEVVTPTLRAILAIAKDVQSLNHETLPISVAQARKVGVSDEEIHDTVLVASFGAMCNRYVDGLGTTFKPGEPEQGGVSLAHYGYTMGISRFFKEVVPQLWANLWK